MSLAASRFGSNFSGKSTLSCAFCFAAVFTRASGYPPEGPAFCAYATAAPDINETTANNPINRFIKVLNTYPDAQTPVRVTIRGYLFDIDTPEIQVTTFYRFVRLDDVEDLQARVKQTCLDLEIQGTILLAEEGINATVSGTPQNLAALFQFFDHDSRLANLERKDSPAGAHPFTRLRVRRKREIVTMRQPLADPNQKVGEYVEPEDWNELVSNPDVKVVDVRNRYEIRYGTFQNAVDPDTAYFWEFPYWAETNLPDKSQPVAMFCTGGIRCEKATAYLKQIGYEKVYHLKGGILKYIEEVPRSESQWEGNCYVFDHRGTVDHDLNPAGPNHQEKGSTRNR